MLKAMIIVSFGLLTALLAGGCPFDLTTAKAWDATELADSDHDGVPDDQDGCPHDPDKTSPGVCGCGSPDTDADGDDTPDCDDGCPDDPDKTSPGVCGCGRPDTDADGDGAPDCDDGCPDDPDKTSPAVCGCGIPDTDGDGDGTPDCDDGCPDDPDKTEPGNCGCREPETADCGTPPGKVQWRVEDGGNGHYYEAVYEPSGITWAQAKAAAEQAGGYLASITSSDENAFVYALVTDPKFWIPIGNPDTYWGPWLGGHRDAANEHWYWVSGESWGFSPWDDYMDNTADQGVHFHGTHSPEPKWNDLTDSSSVKGYVVEWGDDPDGVQWRVEDGGNGHYYEAVYEPSGITWAQAKAAAEQAGGYLASITGSEENAFVYALVDDPKFWIPIGSPDTYWGPWLGGHRDAANQHWYWVSGEPWSYAPWDNYMDNTADQGVHFHGTHSPEPKWNDLTDSSSVKGYVVEWDE